MLLHASDSVCSAGVGVPGRVSRARKCAASDAPRAPEHRGRGIKGDRHLLHRLLSLARNSRRGEPGANPTGAAVPALAAHQCGCRFKLSSRFDSTYSPQPVEARAAACPERPAALKSTSQLATFGPNAPADEEQSSWQRPYDMNGSRRSRGRIRSW